MPVPLLRIHLDRNHHLVPGSSEITQGFANNLFAPAVGVNIGGVEEVDTQRQRSFGPP